MPLHVENLRRRHLRTPLGEAGASWAGFHTFRHTFASMKLESGAKVTEVAALLGHSSPRVTLDTYLHWLRSDEAEALDLDAGSWAGSSTLFGFKTAQVAARRLGRRSALRELGEQAGQVELVPGLGDEAVADPQDRGRSELDPAAGRCDAGGLARVRPGPPLMGRDEVSLGKDELGVDLEVGKCCEELGDRPALALATASLAVVDEIIGQETIEGVEVMAAHHLGVEAGHQGLVRRELAGARRTRGYLCVEGP